MNSLYKEAFLSTLANKAGTLIKNFKNSNRYVMDAVKNSRAQYTVADSPMTMHGTILKALDENGAVGAGAIRTGLDKVRSFAEDVDTGLGAMLMGKKNYMDPNSKSFRKTLFTYGKGNTVEEKLTQPNQYGGTRTYHGASRPSATAPLGSVGKMAVPGLAMVKGMELINKAKAPSEEQVGQQSNQDAFNDAYYNKGG